MNAGHIYIYQSFGLLNLGHTIDDASELERTGPGYPRLTFLPPQLSASSSTLRDRAPRLMSVPKGLGYLFRIFWGSFLKQILARKEKKTQRER